jgi:hypothetical protein
MQRKSVNNILAEVSVGTWDDGNTMRQVQLTIPEDIRLMSDIPVVQLSRISGGSINPPPIAATTSIASTLVPVGTVVITPVLTATPLPVMTGTAVATATKVDN